MTKRKKLPAQVEFMIWTLDGASVQYRHNLKNAGEEKLATEALVALIQQLDPQDMAKLPPRLGLAVAGEPNE